MNSKGFALKVLGIEAVIVGLLGTGAFFYVKSVDDGRRSGFTSQPQRPSVNPGRNQTPDIQTFSASYVKDGKGVKELAASIQLRPGVDLIVFVIDTSGSMQDDRQDLRDSINKITSRYKGLAFTVVNFTGVAQVASEPTHNLAEVQRCIDSGVDLQGDENSYLALTTAASKAREKFKTPAIVLMTDAAPNDGRPGSNSHVTIDDAADALNAANAELHVWAAFDFQEYITGGSAATTSLYPELVGKVKAGGKIYFVKRDNFDPNSLLQPFK
ncbi:MAG TPA: vWA domain-containing protein [Blastocatellia bacterium]